MGLDYDTDIREKFINNLKKKMVDYKLDTIYLASPPNVSSNDL